MAIAERVLSEEQRNANCTVFAKSDLEERGQKGFFIINSRACHSLATEDIHTIIINRAMGEAEIIWRESWQENKEAKQQSTFSLFKATAWGFI